MQEAAAPLSRPQQPETGQRTEETPVNSLTIVPDGRAVKHLPCEVELLGAEQNATDDGHGSDRKNVTTLDRRQKSRLSSRTKDGAKVKG
ncbi:hypothetical protein F2P81_012466 [Scophthalmus maximus]|uniref:Uncharacterized protein n=1 Tax=Scophthalmus maximus TaxID=52904 RepID=A0A6A4SRF8_SCOMX|nr:hypothetical protein F2P81_012466 [Scophthalmus maximus]